MRVLVVGSGGREHALAWALAREADVVCAPGNPGIGEDVELAPVQASDLDGIVSLAADRAVDLVVVGPEDPLVAGLADRLRAAGIATFGPGAAGARLEGSKAFSKAVMVDAGIPTARHRTFTEPEPARDFARALFDTAGGAVVKASGAALGKGAIVCDTAAQADAAIDDMLVRNLFGQAGEEIVVEQRLKGPEFSLLTIVSDRSFRSLPVAQDYKRAHDGDTGLNTGGMGGYSPVPAVTDSLLARAEAEVVEPLLRELERRGIEFRGILFSGLLVDDGTPYCLEFNVRFGDPETQSVVRRLGPGLAPALLAAAHGEPVPEIQVLPHAAATVVVASDGYPENPRKGFTIELPDAPEAKIFHAGTALRDGRLVNSGGRVFGVTGVGGTVAEARAQAYRTASAIRFDGAWMRTDIGADA